MSLYEDNLSALKHVDEALYQALLSSEDDGTILVGDAADGEQFLAVVKDEDVITLSSIYSPEHVVERFLLQFEERAERLHVMIFGFGSGEAVRRILADRELFEECIVYEPSLMILRKAMEIYPLMDMIGDDRFRLFVGGVNDTELYPYLDDTMDYLNWEYYQYACLPKYRELFREQEASVYARFHQVYHYRNVDQNTLIHYAAQGSDNEILSFRWLMDGKNFYDMRQHISEQDVCIVVASGPSLQKNVEELKKAKGKALIFCVDSAAKILLAHDIMPDLLCTVDPDKGGEPLADYRLADIPIAMSPESDHRMLEMMGTPHVLCFSAGNAYHQDVFKQAGCDMPYFDGGGSVATNCFKLAAAVGFRTIILAGQDLALQDGRIHAESDHEEQSGWQQLKVKGYYGGEVTTLSDFKLYLDWYVAQISQLEGCRVINATEGGARIDGAEQMPLKDAIERYCVHDLDFQCIYGSMPEIWSTKEQKQGLYELLKDQYEYLSGLGRMIEETIGLYKESILLYKSKRLTEKRAIRLNQASGAVMNEIVEGQASILIYKRMLETELDFRRHMYEASLSSTADDMDKMNVMLKYLQEASRCVSDMRSTWTIVLDALVEYRPDEGSK